MTYITVIPPPQTPPGGLCSSYNPSSLVSFLICNRIFPAGEAGDVTDATGLAGNGPRRDNGRAFHGGVSEKSAGVF